ncbi:DUF5071 domain-containing protein [Wansuia hejianensis]|uniref:DUF5071 domain-containing protein n=1 Tax=Wansuia hejianensis TaxID=2763667 RepID=A0A7G9GCS2_9FIRM|nr:DUF5071 domain-containing protein [Wansuia hejianensis]QNM08604.1 DUF5071 domain-containing protein [Wansuia hejianensis]RHV90078.1 DUF5071 domain-containing protein [Lachnospiraceae bacterium OF09-33XD]
MLKDIFCMLDEDNDKKTQNKGIEMAKIIQDISPFLQPVEPQFNKNIWHNCAVIICNRSDKQLEAYLDRILEWLQDMNWPGAFLVSERLENFSGELLLPHFLKAIKICLDQADEAWLDNLSLLIKNKELSLMLDETLYKELKVRYNDCWTPKI